MKTKTFLPALAVVILAATVNTALAQVDPDAMSVHYPGRPSAPSVISVGESGMASADVLYAEARVEKSTPGTFFCVLLGEAFYFGLQ